jgi:hypothetical protein
MTSQFLHFSYSYVLSSCVPNEDLLRKMEHDLIMFVGVYDLVIYWSSGGATFWLCCQATAQDFGKSTY